MKRKTKILVFSSCMVLFPLINSAQIVNFEYDEAGNRIARDIIYLKTTDADSSKQVKEYTEMLGETTVTISPNPNGGIFTLKIEGSNAETPTEVFLHSLSGTLIYENREAGLLTEVDISRRQSGTYILTLIIEGKREIWKVVKQ